MCNLLINREIVLNKGRVNWYSALDYFRKFKSVYLVDFYDTCSSAGDWSGYVVQRIKNRFYMILFSQENNWPHSGYSVCTGENVIASWDGELSRGDIDSILDEHLRN